MADEQWPDAGGRRKELAAFLKSRRARLQPSDVGLRGGGRRRVTGLRREEVAAVADVGLTWYTALETGVEIGVSESTLDRIADALKLGTAERKYLFCIGMLPSRYCGTLIRPAQRPSTRWSRCSLTRVRVKYTPVCGKVWRAASSLRYVRTMPLISVTRSSKQR